MVQWAAFAAIAGVVLVLMLVLSHMSAEAVDELGTLSPAALLANVAVTHGLFGVILVAAIVYTGVPADALGIAWSNEAVRTGLVVGVPLGLGLYALNELGAAMSTHLGLDHDETLRELLAPSGPGGWVILLVGVLPIVALFEELLFRAVLIGALAAGFDVSTSLLVVGSSIAFALGHGVQGSVGVVVTGLLGLVLAVAFVATGSFLVVVVAHYVVNALEFAVHEGLGFDWASVLEAPEG